MPHLIINDFNFNQFIGKGPVDGGYGLIPRDYNRVAYGSIEYATSVSLPLIPQSEWFDRIADMDRSKSSLVDIIDDVGVPKMFQNGIGYCHAFCLAHAAMCLRAMQNQPFTRLSPSSVAGPITGYRNKGAWIYDDLKQIAEVGIAETEFYEELTTRNVWTPQAEASAARNKVTEWWELQRRHVGELVTCLLSGFPVPVGLNWWSHAINYLKLVVIRPKVIGVLAQNSHSPDSNPDDGRLILELVDLTNPNKPRYGKGVPDEAYAPRQLTASLPLAV